ncbi:hypothetical protein CL615_00035 [archaeon]|jgi:hypothetical protein|nr:hypothetical protein [archaeon]|tara:strand:- start:3222 stop:5687 length:2466 start_codon:yes stop_codon:yes gene_type:complete
MNKKFSLIAVFLFLIVLLSNAVYAAKVLGIETSGLGVVAINAVIIAALFFILQAFLMPDNSSGMQKGTVYFAIVAVSIVSAWFIGNTFMWNYGAIGTFFNIKVVVNTALLSAVLYFLMQLGPESLKSMQGKKGGLVLVIIVSAFLAMQFTFPEGTTGGRFIWQSETFGMFKNYLFGDQGILTAKDQRIFVFIGASVLFAWLFKMLIKPEGVGDKLNYFFAIIVAANMAHMEKPISTDGLIWMGEAIVAMAIYRGAGTSTVGWHWRASFAAFFTHLMAYLAFGEKAFLGGWPYSMMGFDLWPPSLSWIWIILFPFILAGGIGTLFLAIGKGEEKEEADKYRMGKDAIDLSWAKFNSFVRRSSNPMFQLISRIFYLKDKTQPGEVPNVLRGLRVELQVLMNFMLRLEVYAGKINSVIKGFYKARYIKGIIRTTHPDDIKDSLTKYMIGPQIILEDNKLVLEKETKDYKNIEDEEEATEVKGNNPGFTNNAFIISKLMNQFVVDLSSPLKVDDHGELMAKLAEENGKQSGILKDMKDIMVDRSKRKYDGHRRRYGIKHHIRSLELIYYDQYRLYGKYEHFYRFAENTAKFTLHKWDELSSDGFFKTIKPNPVPAIMETDEELGFDEKKTGQFYEVNIGGYVLEDINNIQVENKDGFGGYIRKIKKTDTFPWWPPEFPLDWLKQDWEQFINDVRDGRHHPQSRSFSDYAQMHEVRNFSYSNLSRTPPKKNYPAFDREALKDPGKFVYLGKKKYHHHIEEQIGIDIKNPYPSISIQGISRYIKDIVEIWVKETEMQEEHIRRYVLDSAQPKENFFTRDIKGVKSEK